MFDLERHKRLKNAEKVRKGNEGEVFKKIFNILKSSGDGKIHLNGFVLEYKYAEVFTDNHKELGVIENIPESLEDTQSMSFDVITDGKKEREILFERSSVSLFPMDLDRYERKILKEIMES